MSTRPLISLLGLGLVTLAASGCTGVDCTETPWDPECRTDTGETGEVGIPTAVVDPCGWDFGAVEVGSVTSKGMKVTNTGVATLEIESITVAAPFTVGGGAGVQVDSGQSYQFTVRFEPDAYGAFEGTLTVTTNDPVHPVTECAVSGRVNEDADNDGYASQDSGGDDCDDEDASINPGATEKWYDGVDQDCDGHSDYDQDFDGYDSEVFNPDPDTMGGDCVDANPDIHPGAEDIWYDGVDSDCDGTNDYDQDGDTWLSDDYGGEDCDDTDPDVSPEGTEAFNGTDDDCDGEIDNDALADEADVIVYGDSTNGNERAGYSLAVGDFDDDGLADVAIGIPYYTYNGYTAMEGYAQGSVALFMGEGWADNDETDSDSDWEIEGEDSMGEFGSYVANIGDWDDDGVDDLAVGASSYDSKNGRVYVFSGVDVNGADYSDAILTIDGMDDSRLGLSVAEHTDMNGDGLSDLLMFGVASHAQLRNYLGLHYGDSDDGSLAWTDLDSTWRVRCGEAGSASWCGGYSSSSSDAGGTKTWSTNVHPGADIDGDGYDDVLIGDYLNDDEANQAGRVWVLWGSSTEYSLSNGGLNGTATTITQGAAVKDYIGMYVYAAPDADGDGDAEIYVSDGAEDIMYFMEGGTDVADGNFDLATDFDAELDWTLDDISAFSNAGDWTGDGVDDIAVSFGESGGASGGAIVLFESQIWSGSYDADDETSGSLLGATDLDGDDEDDGQYFGLGIPQTMGDLDSDSATDLVIGDMGLYEEQGGVFFFYNNR